MLAHRLSGFTGPVPSAALDKQVFSCVRQISYHPAVILSRTDVNFLDTLPEMMEMSRCLPIGFCSAIKIPRRSRGYFT